MPYCEIQGVNIGYQTSGSPDKGQTILFVHGAAGNASRWEKQLEEFKKEHYGIAIDLPGHPPSEGQVCDQIFLYREWVKEFALTMGLTEFVLAGHSMGGGIAMDYALVYPDEVKALLLVGTAAKFHIPKERIDAMKQGKYDPASAKTSFSPSVDLDLLERFMKESAEMDPMIRYTDLVACNRYKERGIEKIQCPTLVICGKDDQGTTPEDSKHIVSRIEESKLSLIDDAGHYVMMEQPEPVNKDISAFLNSL